MTSFVLPYCFETENYADTQNEYRTGENDIFNMDDTSSLGKRLNGMMYDVCEEDVVRSGS